MQKALKSRSNAIRQSQQGEREETARKAALKWLIAFLAIMLVLTISSNALTELSVALVTLTSPQRGTLERAVSAEGALTAGDEIPLWMSEVYRVSEVFVSVGEEVTEGDPLFRFDLAQLQTQLETAQLALEKQENTFASSLLVTNNSAPDTTLADAKLKLERQQEDFDTAVANQDRKVAEAEAAVSDAVIARDKAQAEYDSALVTATQDAHRSAQEAVVKAQQTLTNAQYSLSTAQMTAQQSEAKAYNDYNNALASGTDASAAKLALDIALNNNAANLLKAQQSLAEAQQNYSKAVDTANNIDVTNTVASKKTALENAENNITSKQTALETALRDRETALNSAQRSLDDVETAYAKAAAQASASNKNQKATDEKTALSLANSELDLQAKRDEVAAIQQKIDEGGVVLSPASGMITALNVTQYATPATNAPLVKLSDVDAGLTLTVQVSSANAEYMAVGDDVTITLENGMARSTIAAINAVSGNSNVNEVVVYLSSSAGKVGDKVRFRFSKRTENYDALIPLSALNQDSDGYFVYATRTEDGALGARLTVERIDVTLLDQDANRAAVSGGVRQSDKLVERSNRTLSDGDRVRSDS